jgi:hypothetical protein
VSQNPSTIPAVLELVTNDFELAIQTGVIVQGKDGRNGTGGDSYYEYTQIMPDDTWVITHTLNKKPSVTVVNSAGEVVIGSIQYQSDSQVTVFFGGAFSGKAYLN